MVMLRREFSRWNWLVSGLFVCGCFVSALPWVRDKIGSHGCNLKEYALVVLHFFLAFPAYLLTESFFKNGIMFGVDPLLYQSSNFLNHLKDMGLLVFVVVFKGEQHKPLVPGPWRSLCGYCLSWVISLHHPLP